MNDHFSEVETRKHILVNIEDVTVTAAASGRIDSFEFFHEFHPTVFAFLLDHMRSSFVYSI